MSWRTDGFEWKIQGLISGNFLNSKLPSSDFLIHNNFVPLRKCVFTYLTVISLGDK